MEIVKIVIGLGKEHILTERMVIFEGLTMKFRNVRIRGKNPACIACSENATISNVADFDYADFCQMNCDVVASIQLPAKNTISIEAFSTIYQSEAEMEKCCLVDVRNQVQYGITHLPNSVNIPFKTAMKERGELARLASSHEKVFIMCRRGIDSKDLTDKLI